MPEFIQPAINNLKNTACQRARFALELSHALKQLTGADGVFRLRQCGDKGTVGARNVIENENDSYSTRQSNNVNFENAVTLVENTPIQAGELQKLNFKIFPEFPESRNKKKPPQRILQTETRKPPQRILKVALIYFQCIVSTPSTNSPSFSVTNNLNRASSGDCP